MPIRSDSGKSIKFNSSEMFRHLNGFCGEIGSQTSLPLIESTVGWPFVAKLVQIETWTRLLLLSFLRYTVKRDEITIRSIAVNSLLFSFNLLEMAVLNK